MIYHGTVNPLESSSTFPPTIFFNISCHQIGSWNSKSLRGSKNGDSAGNLLGVVKWPFKWLFVTSNWWIKRSLLEAPNEYDLCTYFFAKKRSNMIYRYQFNPNHTSGNACLVPTFDRVHNPLWQGGNEDLMEVQEWPVNPHVPPWQIKP